MADNPKDGPIQLSDPQPMTVASLRVGLGLLTALVIAFIALFVYSDSQSRQIGAAQTEIESTPILQTDD